MTEWLNTPINLQVQGPVDYFLLGEGRRKEECAEEKTDAGRDWGQEKKGTTDDEMAGWHHWLDARESGWTPGVGDGQGGLACCNSCGRKESDTTERLNWTELNWATELNWGLKGIVGNEKWLLMRIEFGGMMKCLKLIVVIAVHLHDYSKNCRII